MSTPAKTSYHATRCDFDRLHRDTTHSPDLDDCKKRKRQQTTPRTDHPDEPAAKRRRGRPAKGPATPVTQGTASSNSRSSFLTRQRYPLRSQGQLPTPRPSQQQTPETDEGTDDDSVVSGPASSPPRRTPSQVQELEDTIMVNNSTIASSDSGSDDPDQTHTPDDASIIRETPSEEQPGLEVAGEQDSPSPFLRRAPDLENPFINRPAVNTRFSCRLASNASDREENNIHYATRGNNGQGDRDYQAEADGLRASRTALRENLEASTALVHTLQNRLMKHEGDVMADRALLTQAQADVVNAQAEVQEGRTLVVRLGSTLVIFVFGVAAYAVWTWVNGPEMQYIRKRRGDVLME